MCLDVVLVVCVSMCCFGRLSAKLSIRFKVLVITCRALQGHTAYIRDLPQPCVTSRSLMSFDEGRKQISSLNWNSLYGLKTLWTP